MKTAETLLADAVRTLADFAVLHAALVLSERDTGWAGAVNMASASTHARRIIREYEAMTGKSVKLRSTVKGPRRKEPKR